MRLADKMSEGVDNPRIGEIRDEHVSITCPTCRTRQTFAEAMISETDAETVYRCVNGCAEPLAIVQPTGFRVAAETSITIPPKES